MESLLIIVSTVLLLSFDLYLVKNQSPVVCPACLR